MIDVKFARLIKLRRERKCLTQDELADMANLGSKGYTTISKWENGRHIPSMENAKLLADILGGEPYEYREL